MKCFFFLSFFFYSKLNYEESKRRFEFRFHFNLNKNEEINKSLEGKSNFAKKNIEINSQVSKYKDKNNIFQKWKIKLKKYMLFYSHFIRNIFIEK